MAATTTPQSMPSPPPQPSSSSPSSSSSSALDVVYGNQWLHPLEYQYTLSQLSDFADRNQSIGWFAVSLYFICFLTGTRLMLSRPAFSLKPVLFLWNSGLALFSIAGAFRMQQEFRHILQTNGWHGTYCTKPTADVTAFWIFLFTASKFAEFGDTALLVLRKKPVIFLHWYHHITTLLFCVYMTIDFPASGRYVVLMNYGVHSLMYSYYAAVAIGARIPKPVSILLTILQITQMIIGLSVMLLTAGEYYSGNQNCATTGRILASGSMIYGSFLVLFVNFFLQSYVFGNKKRSGNQVNGKQQPEINGNIRSKRE